MSFKTRFTSKQDSTASESSRDQKSATNCMYCGFCQPINGMCQILVYYSYLWTTNCEYIMPNLNDVSMQLVTFKDYMPLFNQYFDCEECNSIYPSYRPQDFIINRSQNEWFDGFPKMKELLMRKAQVNQGRSHPEMHLTVDHKEFDLTSLGKFDAILIDLPLPEYRERVLPHKDFELNPKIEK